MAPFFLQSRELKQYTRFLVGTSLVFMGSCQKSATAKLNSSKEEP